MPRTGISSGILRAIIEYGPPLSFLCLQPPFSVRPTAKARSHHDRLKSFNGRARLRHELRLYLPYLADLLPRSRTVCARLCLNAYISRRPFMLQLANASSWAVNKPSKLGLGRCSVWGNVLHSYGLRCTDATPFCIYLVIPFLHQLTYRSDATTDCRA